MVLSKSIWLLWNNNTQKQRVILKQRYATLGDINDRSGREPGYQLQLNLTFSLVKNINNKSWWREWKKVTPAHANIRPNELFTRAQCIRKHTCVPTYTCAWHKLWFMGDKNAHLLDMHRYSKKARVEMMSVGYLHDLSEKITVISRKSARIAPIVDFSRL